MQQYKLNVSSREQTGRGPVRRLRNSGRIPASVYGKGNARSVSVSAVEFRDLNREIGGEAALVELTDERGDSMLTLVKNVDYHSIKNEINHIDFHEVKRGESFVARVPVHLAGDADCVGVKIDGGMLEILLHELEIRCRPSKLPECIEVNVAELAGGSAVHISELPEIEGVEYLGKPEDVVVSCNVGKGGAEVEETPAAAPEAESESGEAEAPAEE